MNTPEPPAPNRVVQIREAVGLFRKVATRIARIVQQSRIASADEKKEIATGLRDVLEALEELERRTTKVLVRENSELYKLSEISLGVKWDRQSQDLEYMVALGTTMLEKLYMKKYLTDDEYLSLRAFWMQTIPEHDRLAKLWSKANQ
jgi:hypothetical protein